MSESLDDESPPRASGIRERADDDTIFTTLAVWLGNEKRGLSDLAIGGSELCVSIPRFGMVESLDLGTTSGIVPYEVTTQRRAYQRRCRRSGERRPRRQS